jgi:hypothetical protein
MCTRKARMAYGDWPIDQPDHDFGPTAGEFHQRGERDQIQWVHEVLPVLERYVA